MPGSCPCFSLLNLCLLLCDPAWFISGLHSFLWSMCDPRKMNSYTYLISSSLIFILTLPFLAVVMNLIFLMFKKRPDFLLFFFLVIRCFRPTLFSEKKVVSSARQLLLMFLPPILQSNFWFFSFILITSEYRLKKKYIKKCNLAIFLYLEPVSVTIWCLHSGFLICAQRLHQPDQMYWHSQLSTACHDWQNWRLSCSQ